MSQQPVDYVPVMRFHLEQIHQALDAATGYHLAEDIQQDYRQVKPNTSKSRLTAALERALGHTRGYLEEGTDDELS